MLDAAADDPVGLAQAGTSARQLPPLLLATPLVGLASPTPPLAAVTTFSPMMRRMPATPAHATHAAVVWSPPTLLVTVHARVAAATRDLAHAVRGVTYALPATVVGAVDRVAVRTGGYLPAWHACVEMVMASGDGSAMGDAIPLDRPTQRTLLARPLRLIAYHVATLASWPVVTGDHLTRAVLCYHDVSAVLDAMHPYPVLTAAAPVGDADTEDSDSFALLQWQLRGVRGRLLDAMADYVARQAHASWAALLPATSARDSLVRAALPDPASPAWVVIKRVYDTGSLPDAAATTAAFGNLDWSAFITDNAATSAAANAAATDATAASSVTFRPSAWLLRVLTEVARPLLDRCRAVAVAHRARVSVALLRPVVDAGLAQLGRANLPVNRCGAAQLLGDWLLWRHVWLGELGELAVQEGPTGALTARLDEPWHRAVAVTRLLMASDIFLEKNGGVPDEAVWARVRSTAHAAAAEILDH